MISLLFGILLIVVVFKLAMFAVKATWGIAKVVLGVVLFPLILIGLALSGFMVAALIALAIAGVATLIASAVA